MAPQAKKSSITNFFKPVPQNYQTSPLPNRPKTPPVATPSPPGIPKSSPSSESIKVEIQASDDEDLENSENGSSSDNELEDFMAKFDPRKNVIQTTPSKKYGTPRAKRTMLHYMSPSPSKTKSKPIFDMKALLRDAQNDDDVDTSYLRVNAQEEQEASSSQTPASKDDSYSDEVFLNVVKDNSGQSAQKVLRAVQRAAESGISQPKFHFFDPEFKPPPAPKPPSKSVLKGPWRLLAQGDGQSREQFLVSGLPMTLVAKHKDMPEQLFGWILDDLCVNPSVLVRKEYCHLIAKYPNYAEAILTPTRLRALFSRLGARQDVLQSEESLETHTLAEDSFSTRDFSKLRSFLQLIGHISKCLTTESVQELSLLLLKMSADQCIICNIGLLVEYEKAIQVLLDTIPTASWNSFCLGAATTLYANFATSSIRMNALLCLPVGNKQARTLRRRLAVAFFFQDSKLAGHEPNDTISIKGFTDRLRAADFQISRKSDFDHIRANIMFLDMAIGGGVPNRFTDAEEEKAFNQDVDELANTLGAMTRKINDAGMKLARTEAKSVIEWVQKRISFSVRTKRQRKADIFKTASDNDERLLPRQQTYMKNFLGKT